MRYLALLLLLAACGGGSTGLADPTFTADAVWTGGKWIEPDPAEPAYVVAPPDFVADATFGVLSFVNDPIRHLRVTTASHFVLDLAVYIPPGGAWETDASPPGLPSGQFPPNGMTLVQAWGESGRLYSVALDYIAGSSEAAAIR